MSELRVNLEKIKEAKERIRPYAVETPCNFVPNLSKITDCQLYFKLETLQRCRAFKFRGALSKISTLPKGSTIVCASAGNHSQGCALSAQICGMKCIVYMPITAPITKVDATRGYGAEVRQYGFSFDEANKKCAEDLAANPDWIFVPPFDSDEVIAGQGTIGLEIAQQVPDVDTVVVAVGGGGLAAGTAVAIKALCPKARVIAVNAAVRPASYLKYKNFKGQEIDQNTTTKFIGNPLADGIAVINPGKVTFPYIEQLVDDFVVVTEDEISTAIAYLAERTKMICEGAGASPFAAVLFKKFEYRPDEKIVCVLSGGNIELPMLARCIDRALFLQQRRVNFTISLPVACGQFIKMLQILQQFKFEVVGTFALPNANCLANHIRYCVTVDIPNPALMEDVKAEFEKNGWTINITETHPQDQ
ncbi:Pyridoxal-phosphate dependent enzyme family protein [Trichomonas vaginalis G3]|uniref:Pyridoxal-phosphate dependent enzyme family protein n=1 Tax=Trichomonas vaginalis (strain ATCC PRA-98 / G3) TaxID=412133 RepID=A2FH13_TRIV3|nr:L-threonine ammonia-lyase protein [Trichomonas vaginalis G3]EAX95826.1 Pyridoxal-phosphate dependent enzyme family protein [Trichomonas vaginalis G3]KAI5500560.1 L-threonine ammonia-lyase protein [Trichomonas vaginalis G3]|eukprot:XP_001308756.1 Pyridoxal-phosphate dependent enzyme family protein [Trichomonas vaginalis G3]